MVCGQGRGGRWHRFHAEIPRQRGRRGQAEKLIEARQYVVRSEWSEVQPTAADENDFLERNDWEAYSLWHLGLTDGAQDETKARYAFVFGDLRRLHRSGLMACRFRATQWDHKEIELASTT